MSNLNYIILTGVQLATVWQDLLNYEIGKCKTPAFPLPVNKSWLFYSILLSSRRSAGECPSPWNSLHWYWAMELEPRKVTVRTENNTCPLGLWFSWIKLQMSHSTSIIVEWKMATACSYIWEQDPVCGGEMWSVVYVVARLLFYFACLDSGITGGGGDCQTFSSLESKECDKNLV